MSKPKTEPQTPDLAEHFDTKAIHNAMRMAQGSATGAHALLVEAGLPHTLKWLYDKLQSDRMLRAVWVDGRGGFSDHEAPAKMTPQQVKIVEADMIVADAEFLKQHGAERVFGEDAELMLAMADFGSRDFQTTVNITYGLAVVSAKNLHMRAAEINKSILLNEETVMSTRLDEKGKEVEVNNPKYSDLEKLEWQKEYTRIMETIVKFSASATAAANAKINAFKVAKGGGGGMKPMKSARGGRPFN